MRRTVVLGSAVTASLGLVVGALCAIAGGPAAATGEIDRASATWRPAARVAQQLPTHLDDAPPGVDVRVRPSTADLLRQTAVASRPARTRPTTTRSATSWTSSTSVVRRQTVPAGVAVLGGLGTHVSPSCTGTTDGNRVQVLYAREASTPSRHGDLLPALRSFVADVDDTFALSSPEAGRRVRWVQDAACVPELPEVVVPDGTLAGADITSLIAELDRQGMGRPDRKYLVLADAARLCGVAETYQDDSVGPGNDNDGGVAMYGRVDSGCWVARAGQHSAPAHELMHMLGAVQPSAPHRTTLGHCTDEADALCYADGSGQPMVSTCTAAGAEALFDCNRDDYFDPRPNPTGYLAGAWNTARSSFLDVVGAAPAPVTPAPPTPVTPAPVNPAPVTPPPAPAPAPAVVTVVLTTAATAYVATPQAVAVSVTAGGRPVATPVTLQAYGAATGWQPVGTLSTSSAGTARFVLRASVAGRSLLRAVVPGSALVAAGRSASVSVQVLRRTTALAAAVRAGRPAVLTATVKAGAAPVAGQYLTLQQRPAGSTAWRPLTRKLTNRAGQVTYPVRPARATAYRWLYPGSWSMAPSVSPTTTVRPVR